MAVDAWVIDSDASEALLGVDVIRRIDLRGERAEITLSRTDGAALPALLGELGAAVHELSAAIESMATRSCACQSAIDTLIAKGPL